jgi:hypothetical protein
MLFDSRVDHWSICPETEYWPFGEYRIHCVERYRRRSRSCHSLVKWSCRIASGHEGLVDDRMASDPDHWRRTSGERHVSDEATWGLIQLWQYGWNQK